MSWCCCTCQFLSPRSHRIAVCCWLNCKWWLSDRLVGVLANQFLCINRSSVKRIVMSSMKIWKYTMLVCKGRNTYFIKFVLSCQTLIFVGAAISNAVLEELKVNKEMVGHNALSHSRNMYNMFPEPSKYFDCFSYLQWFKFFGLRTKKYYSNSLYLSK